MTPPKPMEVILAETVAVFGVSVAEILSRCRTRRVVTARHAAIMMGLNFTGYSLTRVGRIMGRDHTSISYAYRAAVGRHWRDEQFATMIGELDRKSVV